ncbi:MAG: Fe-S cluster assembly protein SufD [Rhizobiaceae bacterium]
MNVHATTQNTPAEQALIAQFEASLPGLPGDATVAARRARAFDTLRNGLPTRKVEAWHYTDLRRLLASVPSPDAKEQVAALAPLLEGAKILSVANGKAGSPVEIDGVTLSTLREGLQAGEALDGLQPATADDAVGALNSAFVSDGFRLSVAAGAQVDSPIEFQNLQAGGQTHARFSVDVGAGAKATFVERQAGSGEALVSSVSEIAVADDAEITWIILQEQPDTVTQLGQINATIGKNAKLTIFFMNNGGKLVRQELRIVAAGENGEFKLRGINLLAGSTHCDVTMVLDHDAYGATSTETVRNVITDRAHGVFQGQIRVDREAQKTDAKMACNTLLLSDEGQFSTKPELEIFADDVACGHGATVTEIERQHLFYLMARGVPEKLARGLLVKAFVAEVIEELEDEAIVEALETKLDAWFAEHG